MAITARIQDTIWLIVVAREAPATSRRGNGLLKTVANVNVVLESDTTDIALIRSQCGKEITNASWKMVFAADQAEFDALWENLKETLTGIGWDDLVKFDMEKYQKVIDARKAAK